MPHDITPEQIAEWQAACDAATPGPWHTVEAPWRGSWYDKEKETHVTLPTYVIAGCEDPHAGTPVLAALDIEEWGEDNTYEDQVAKTDCDLGFTALARTALPLLLAERMQLVEDLTEYLDGAFQQIAFLEKDGWWCSQALSTAVGLGDKLVELGTWEHDEKKGYGRMQFYRPIAKQETPKDGL